ncbi:MAG TPA: hypothetical protein VEP89_02415, partial [Draconibacterium sp.]|nr:hypothetical protein [Draconibacterium sp.]
MKNLIYTSEKRSGQHNGFSPFFFMKGTSNSSHETYNNVGSTAYQTEIGGNTLLTPEASFGMNAGRIPNLKKVCRELFNTFHEQQAPYSALQFIPVMQQVMAFDKEDLKRFLKNKEPRHVLVDNRWMKVVLIHWKPGKVSDIHG